MDAIFQVDPREDEAVLFARIPATELVAREAEARAHVQGELHFAATQPLMNSEVPVELRRLGLYDVGGTAPSAISGISLSAFDGVGVARAIDSQGTNWRLSAQITGLVSVGRRQPNVELPADPGYSMAPTEPFSGTISLDLRSTASALATERLLIERGALDLSSERHELHLTLGALAVNTLRPQDTPELIVPIVPVFFRLTDDGWTGSNWTTQLNRANDIWGRCCIRFVPLSVQRIDSTKYTYSTSTQRIRRSFEQEGAVEVYVLASNIGGYTDAGGHASAQVFISEPNSDRENLLAHEFGHVLGGCHPAEGGLSCFWTGDDQTVIEVGTPNPPRRNTRNNCRHGRLRQPLLTTQVPGCVLRPDD